MNILTMLWKNLWGGSRTMQFPLRPKVTQRFRGLVQFDPTRCTGCAICKMRCTSRAIQFKTGKGEFTWSYDPGQCTFCGRCVEGCKDHEAILAKCKDLNIAEAIVFRGIEGYGAVSRIRRSRLFSKDAPIQISIIDTEEQIAKLIPFLDSVVEEGLVASSAVEIIRYSRVSIPPTAR